MTAGWLLAILSTVLPGAGTEIPLAAIDPDGESVYLIDTGVHSCPDAARCRAAVNGLDLQRGWPADGTFRLSFLIAPAPTEIENWGLAIDGVGSAKTCVYWPSRGEMPVADCEQSRRGPGLSHQFEVPPGVAHGEPVHVIVEGTLITPPVLRWGPSEALLRMERAYDLGFGVYYGILLAIAALSLASFFSQGYRTYLWFSALLMLFGGALAGFSGRGFGFLAALPADWHIRAPLVLGLFAIFTLLGFALRYLDLRRSGLATWRGEGWGLMALALIGAACAMAFGHLVIIPAALLLALSCIFVLGLSTSAGLRGSRRGRYLLGSSVVLVTGLLMLSLHVLLSSYGGFAFTMMLIALGSVVMPAVLVTGMYRSFRKMAMERDQARNELMATQRLTILRSHYCRVTGLPRRNKLADMFHALTARGESDHSVGVFLVNVDDLAAIRQQHGRSALEDVIVEIAGRMRDGLDEEQLLGRLEDWELVVVIPTSQSGEGIRRRLYEAAENITACLDRPVRVGSERVPLSVSVGLAVWPIHGTSFDELLRHCDSALYEAQAEGGNRIRVYSEAAFMDRSNRWNRLADLRKALESESLELHYHPIHDAVSGSVRGFEALIRLRQSDGDLLLPGDFIPLAEESELIVDIGYWALAQAVEDLKWLRSEGFSDFFVSLNVSPLQLVGNAFTRQMKTLLDRAGLAGDRLHLEITENRLVDNWNRTREVLHRMKSQGVRVYVDDFGVGYSSLSYLRELPVHGLKIDRSFVRNVGRTSQDEAVLTAVLRLAQSLKLDIIAEGVESAYQKRFLTLQGCGKLQGHLFALPMARPQVLEYLHAPRSDSPFPRGRPALQVSRK